MKKNKVTNLGITHSQIGGFGSRLEMLETISATLNYMRDCCPVHIYRFTVSYTNQFIENLDEAMESVLQTYRESMSLQKFKMEFLWVREYGTYVSDRMPVHHVIIFGEENMDSCMKIKTMLDQFMRGKFKGGDYSIALCLPKKFCINEGMKVKKGFASKTDAMQWLKGLAHQDGRYIFDCKRSYGYSEGHLRKKTKQPMGIEGPKKIVCNTSPKANSLDSHPDPHEVIMQSLIYMCRKCKGVVQAYQFTITYTVPTVNSGSVLESVLKNYRTAMLTQGNKMEYVWAQKFIPSSTEILMHKIIIITKGDRDSNATEVRNQLETYMRNFYKDADYDIQLQLPKEYRYNGGMQLTKGRATINKTRKWLQRIVKRLHVYGFSGGYLTQVKQPVRG